MADETITQNAQHAANTPANDAPDAREARRIEITRDLVGGQLSAADRRTRMDELRWLTSEPDAVAKEDTERTATVSPAERRRQEIMRDPKFLAGDPALVAEMKQILAKQAAEENPQYHSNMNLADKRAEYGLDTDSLFSAPKESKQLWDADGESAFLDLAHEVGAPADMVRDVVFDYVRMREGNEDAGQMADADLDALEAKYQRRGVPKEVTAKFRRWAREGGYI